METKNVIVHWNSPQASIEIDVPIDSSQSEIEKLAAIKFVEDFQNYAKLSWIENF